MLSCAAEPSTSLLSRLHLHNVNGIVHTRVFPGFKREKNIQAFMGVTANGSTVFMLNVAKKILDIFQLRKTYGFSYCLFVKS